MLLYATLLYATLLYATLRYSMLLYATLRYTTLRYSTLLYATLRYSTLLYATLRYSTLLYSTLRYSTLLYATHSRTMLLILIRLVLACTDDLMKIMVSLDVQHTTQQRPLNLTPGIRGLSSALLYLQTSQVTRTAIPIPI
jgi:hypothetical protein